ncbi:MAG: translation elongation factor-like protein [Candidatus Bipolaricaulota bacterium]
MKEIGEVIHYFTDINVGAIRLIDHLEVGDEVKFEGVTTDFSQEIDSIQIDEEPVEEAGPGDEIGTKVDQRVREGDKVYKVEGEDD